MPIKPENKARYPKEWKAIRARILKRAGDCCEWCHVPNKARITRGTGEDAETYMDANANVWCANTGEHFGQTHMSSYECNGRWINIVLTIAHVGLPAHLPVDFHVAASAQANEVVEVVGFTMPLQAEQPEWAHMMHRRTLAEFSAGASATSAGFFVAFPGGDPGIAPSGAVVHVPLAMDPQAIRLTSWRLVAEPLEAARIAAKATAGAQVEPAGLERLTAAFATTLAEPTFRQAQCFTTTGIRTGLTAVRSLLSRQVKGLMTDDAFAHHIASTLGASNARALDATSNGCGVFESALIRAGLSGAPGIVSELASASGALQLGRAVSGASHSGILIHCDDYPENCDDDNLRALCQRCHLKHDREHHAETAKTTRRARLQTPELF